MCTSSWKGASRCGDSGADIENNTQWSQALEGTKKDGLKEYKFRGKLARKSEGHFTL